MSFILDKIFKKNKNKIAIISAENTISYSQLHEETILWSAKLDRTIPNHSAVLVSLDNSADFVILLLSLLYKRCKIYLYDNKAPLDDIYHIANHYDIHFTVTHHTTPNRLSLKDDIAISTLDNNTCLQDCGISFFTSGTTNMPKAFFFNENKLFHTLKYWAEYANMNESDIIFCPLSITHSHGIMLLLPALINGATCIIQHFPYVDIERYLEIISKYKVTLFSAVPYVYAKMLQNDIEYVHNIFSLRLCISGSAPLSKYIEERFFDKFKTPISQGYGLSEIGPISFNKFANERKGIFSVGKILPQITYKIIDKDGNNVSVGSEGELIVQSKWMATAYEKDDIATKEMYKEGWLHTQDIVKEDEEGFIYIIGRKSQFINIAGYKVHPNEVESVLMSIDGILEAWVFPSFDENKGQRICAKIITKNPTSAIKIREQCTYKLPNYKIPSEIHIVDEIKHNTINKKIEKYADFSKNK